MKKLPTLYKKSSTGAIWHWTITTFPVPGQMDDKEYCPTWGVIETVHGMMGSEHPQSSMDTIAKGKNEGKKNATTALEQAEAEAQAKWEKQKKKGYVETIEAAQAGEVDEIIEGGISPMLAHKFTEQSHKIKFPAYVQPKLDGIRCIAIIDGGVCTLWSRTRKPITGVPHIAKELGMAFPTGRHVLDGELYNHDFKENFEQIVSYVRQFEAQEGSKAVQYHVYDIVDQSPFESRMTLLSGLDEEPLHHIHLVKTVLVKDEDELMEKFDEFLALGYEGAMVRNAKGLYANKRSYDLQKIKEFDDAEFEIVGVKEGRGKLQGHAATFVCKMADGQLFEAKMKGDTSRLKDYFENHSLWQGKKLTVKYQGLTNKNGVPRFPVGIALRDYE